MIPVRLNFLSPNKRRNLQTMVIFQLGKSVLEIILIVMCLIGIGLLGAQSVLQDYFNDLSGTIAFTQSRHQQTNREVKEINQTIIQLEKIQAGYKSFLPLFPSLFTNLPNYIYLDGLNVNLEKGSLTLSGFAKKRDQLLNYKKTLEGLTWVKKIDWPLSQITKKDDLPFTLELEIK